MNRTRRRLLVHCLVAVLSALIAIGTFESRINELERGLGPTTSVLLLRRAVTAEDSVSDEMVEAVEVPVRWQAPGTLHDVGELGGRVAAVDLSAGAVLSADVLVAQPEISGNERRAVVLIDRAALADGIRAGAHVDIVAAYDAATVGVARSEIVVGSARVLSVGSDTDRMSDRAGVTDDGGNATSNVGASATGDTVAITFALEPPAVLRVAFAESFASTVRLAMVSERSTGSVPVPGYSPGAGGEQ